MSIKDTMRQTRTLIKTTTDKVSKHHSKDHRREVSQKITDKLNMQEVVDNSRVASDKIKKEGATKKISKEKLVERSLLKLDADAHKKLLSDDIEIWPTALAGKSIDQIGKYLDRAAQSKSFDWADKKDSQLSFNLKTAFQAGGNPYEFALREIEKVSLPKTNSRKSDIPSAQTIATLEKLAYIFSSALLEQLDSGPSAAKKTYVERLKRNAKTDVAIIGKSLEVLGKSLQQKAVRLPSSAVHGAANAIVAAPIVGGGAALIASSVAVLVATQGAAIPAFLIAAAVLYPTGAAVTATGVGLMLKGRNKKAALDSSASSENLPSYSAIGVAQALDSREKENKS